MKVSAATGEGVDALLVRIDEVLADRVRVVEVLLPYGDMALSGLLRANGTVLEEEYRADGLYCKATVRREDLHRFIPYLVQD